MNAARPTQSAKVARRAGPAVAGVGTFAEASPRHLMMVLAAQGYFQARRLHRL